MPTSKEPPFTQAEVSCLASIFRHVGARQLTAIGAVLNSTATGPSQLQNNFTGSLQGFLVTIGMDPIDVAQFGNKEATPDIFITGSIPEHAKLVVIDERQENFGLIAKLFDADKSRGWSIRQGSVTASINIALRSLRGKDIFHVAYANANATVTYYSFNSVDRQSGGILAAIIGGSSKKRGVMIDSQTAASFAVRIAAAKALIAYLERRGSESSDAVERNGAMSMVARARKCLPVNS